MNYLLYIFDESKLVLFIKFTVYCDFLGSFPSSENDREIKRFDDIMRMG